MNLEIKEKQLKKECYTYAFNFYHGWIIEKLAQTISPRYYTKHCNVYIVTEYKDGTYMTAFTFGGYNNNLGVVCPEKLMIKYNKKVMNMYKRKNFPSKKQIYNFFKELIDAIDKEIDNMPHYKRTKR